MSRLLSFALLLWSCTNGVALAQESWLRDESVLSCTPETLRAGQTLTVRLGPNHGRELSVVRQSDGVGFMLVVGSPPPDVLQLMTTEEFARARTLEIQTTLRATPWVAESRLNEVIFSSTGEYRILVSESLVSERGGHWCRVKFVALEK